MSLVAGKLLLEEDPVGARQCPVPRVTHQPWEVTYLEVTQVFWVWSWGQRCAVQAGHRTALIAPKAADKPCLPHVLREQVRCH